MRPGQDDPGPLNVLVSFFVWQNVAVFKHHGAPHAGDDKIPEVLAAPIEGLDMLV
jgi:hypothetical protein